MYNCVKKYSHIRGFNYQPDWGGCGVTVWLRFNAERYRMILRRGKAAFPKMNAVRIWLSFDAWYEDREFYLKSIREAGKIITEEGLKFIPVYFNGWFSLPNFGGFTVESLHPEKIGVYKTYLAESLEQFSDAAVLMHDISNEPYNNTLGNRWAVGRVTDFLTGMADIIHKNDPRPATVGTQGYIGMAYNDGGKWSDIDILSQAVDVISLHPYNIQNLPIADFEKQLSGILEHVETLGKPVIITESIWGAEDAERRRPFLESELRTYGKLSVGFLCHALSVSPVADLHPLVGPTNPEKGLYMAFLDENFNIRPYHGIFNEIDC